MKLEDIGFYTLSEKRAKQASAQSPLWRCELILTGRCNFHCPYCRGLSSAYQTDLPFETAEGIVREWQKGGLKNIRFSGGEPTLYDGLVDLVSIASETCERVAISTNGSADFRLYAGLIRAGANDISISLDACCASTSDIMSGTRGMFGHVCENIIRLSELTYVTVGIVLTPENAMEISGTISMAHNLGVADIRIIPAAQQGNTMRHITCSHSISKCHPILCYRIDRMTHGLTVRGLDSTSSKRCYLVMDDMAVVGTDHYPCIIYLREQGKPIGRFNGIEKTRLARNQWSEEHDCMADPICRLNCLDVCVEYNNHVRDYYANEVPE